MISKNLLTSTFNRAVGFLTYGGPGLDKTFSIRTLPPPILHLDLEGGAAPLLPWTRRMRRWDEREWTDLSDQQREAALSLVPEARRKGEAVVQLPPAPFIDSIWFDVQEVRSYSTLVEVIGNFDFKSYNSLALDPLYEFSETTKAKAKAAAGRSLYIKAEDGTLADTQPMELNWWGGAQERAAILLRTIRKLRDYGIFIYITSSEQIEKEYVRDPRERKAGEPPQEPYNIKGSANVAGKLVNEVQHLTDIMMHARSVNGRAVWVTQQEPMSGGQACWEAKDRFGRLSAKYMPSNFRRLMADLYGREVAQTIYGTQNQTSAQSNG